MVTGASSGIGKETALRYAASGACLTLGARSEDLLHGVADECLAAGATDVLVQTTDIAEADQVQRLFDAAEARFGRIDIAVQCAAITSFGRFEDVPVEVFDAIVRTNLLGSANVARCALKHFQARDAGHLVLVGSLLGSAAVPYQTAYVASKFGLNGLVRALRQENRDFAGHPGAWHLSRPGRHTGLRDGEQLLRPHPPDTAHRGGAFDGRGSDRSSHRSEALE